MTYNSLQGIFTTMIGFITWSPYIKDDGTKGGQVDPSDKANHSCENAL